MDAIRNDIIENRTFDEIALGDSASLVRTLTQDDIDLFAIVSGDVNPVHLDPIFAKTDEFHRIVGHGMWTGSLISAVVGTKLPGLGAIYLSQELRFLAPIGIGDVITTTVTVLEKPAAGHDVILGCRCVNAAGVEVVSGTARVRAPTEKMRRPRRELPDVQLSRHVRFRELLARAACGSPMPVAVVHPCDAASLGAVVEAAEAGLVAPILVGPLTKIRAVAAALSLDLTGLRLVDAPHSHAAAWTCRPIRGRCW